MHADGESAGQPHGCATDEPREEGMSALARDLRLAALVHRSLLPAPLRTPHIDVDIRYQPVDRIGGDYCQVHLADASTCYITLCDVCGHGIGSALLATRVSSEVRYFIGDRLPPREIVRRLNEFVYGNFRGTGLFLTFIAARIDLRRRTLTYSGAGHPGPLWWSRRSDQVRVLPSQNMVIGLLEDCLGDEAERTVQLDQGDRLLFYTDGVTEAADADAGMLREEGLARIFHAASSVDLTALADHTLEQVSRHGQAEDDQTLIVAEIK